MAWSSIRKRESKSGIKYQASVKEKSDGRNITIWSGTYPTKGEAQAAAAEYLDGVNKGSIRHVVDKSTFKNFCLNVWLPSCRVKVERAEPCDPGIFKLNSAIEDRDGYFIEWFVMIVTGKHSNKSF